MSCCLYWVILDERLSVRVLASAVDTIIKTLCLFQNCYCFFGCIFQNKYIKLSVCYGVWFWNTLLKALRTRTRGYTPLIWNWSNKMSASFHPSSFLKHFNPQRREKNIQKQIIFWVCAFIFSPFIFHKLRPHPPPPPKSLYFPFWHCLLRYASPFFSSARKSNKKNDPVQKSECKIYTPDRNRNNFRRKTR